MLVPAVCLGWERCPQWHGGRGWRHWVGLGCLCSQRTCWWWLLGFRSFQVAPACHWCHDVVVFSFFQAHACLAALNHTSLHCLWFPLYLELPESHSHRCPPCSDFCLSPNSALSAIHKQRLQKCVHFWCNPHPEDVGSSIVLTLCCISNSAQITSAATVGSSSVAVLNAQQSVLMKWDTSDSIGMSLPINGL